MATALAIFFFVSIVTALAWFLGSPKPTDSSAEYRDDIRLDRKHIRSNLAGREQQATEYCGSTRSRPIDCCAEFVGRDCDNNSGCGR
jgi:hypothetical protein